MVSSALTEPLRFAPFLRPMPWGGRRLAELAGDRASDVPIGEAWLLSDHTLHSSRVVDGPFQGQTLSDLVQRHGPELIGHAAGRFPLLVKLLDARENLSVQVHPDDALARHWAPADGGKTEAWVVLGTSPEAVIYLGLKAGVDAKLFARELATGTAATCLNAYRPKVGETYFVPAGTVHALGGGTMVLEVQQTSDATFRLYDWGRVGPDGKPRTLHLEAGLACLKPHVHGAGLQVPRPNGQGGHLVMECPYFTITHWRGPTTATLSRPGILIGMGDASRCSGPSYDATLGHAETLLFPLGVACTVHLPGPNARVFQINWPVSTLLFKG